MRKMKPMVIEFEDGLLGWVEQTEEDDFACFITYPDYEINDSYPMAFVDDPDFAFLVVQKIWNGTYEVEYEPCSCSDCGWDTYPTEYYMVHDHIWYNEAGMSDGYLCLGCLEARIGRYLNLSDFTPYPINNVTPQNSARMNDRLTRKEQKWK